MCQFRIRVNLPNAEIVFNIEPCVTCISKQQLYSEMCVHLKYSRWGVHSTCLACCHSRPYWTQPIRLYTVDLYCGLRYGEYIMSLLLLSMSTISMNIHCPMLIKMIRGTSHKTVFALANTSWHLCVLWHWQPHLNYGMLIQMGRILIHWDWIMIQYLQVLTLVHKTYILECSLHFTSWCSDTLPSYSIVYTLFCSSIT